MNSPVMTHRRFSLLFATIALPTLAAIFLSSCTAPQSNSSNGKRSNPEALRLETSEDAVTSASSDASISPATADNDVTISQDQGNSSSASQSSTTPDLPIESPTAALSPNADSTETEISSPITIDETVCGAGGHEAFFATKAQEIYICKNDTGALTYIATPKRKGNSLFLPAQKIQQGKLVGYVALDEAKTYIVTSGGFQLQEEGKPTQSEKVVRRKLAKD